VESTAIDLRQEDAQAAPSAAPAEARHRPLHKRIRRAVRHAVARVLLAVGKIVLPRLYVAYMWFVWKTSRIEDCGLESLHAIIREKDGAVGLLWHEEVFSVAYAYKHFRPHTLASLGDAGEVITELLRLCGFTVFRGGSSMGKKRRRAEVLDEMIRHMRETREVIYGITVDGSIGPKYHLKHGGIAIAQACNRPVITVRTWAKRYFTLPTWDRMAIPLPFNHVKQYMRGPWRVPEDADDPAVFEAFRRRVEDEMIALAEQSHRDFGRVPPPRPARVEPAGAAT